MQPSPLRHRGALNDEYLFMLFMLFMLNKPSFGRLIFRCILVCFSRVKIVSMKDIICVY